MKTIINFLKGLFNESGDVSSKRVVGFCAFVAMVIMIFAEQFFGFKMNMAALGILLSLVLACFGLNALLQSKSMRIKESVANDIIKNTQDNETAKDVLQSDKPSA